MRALQWVLLLVGAWFLCVFSVVGIVKIIEWVFG
jgi:hypothetical protein